MTKNMLQVRRIKSSGFCLSSFFTAKITLCIWCYPLNGSETSVKHLHRCPKSHGPGFLLINIMQHQWPQCNYTKLYSDKRRLNCVLNHVSVIHHSPDRWKGNLLLISDLPVCLNLAMEIALCAFMYVLVQAHFSALAMLRPLAGESFPHSTYLGSVYYCLHSDGSWGLHLGAHPGWGALPTRGASLSHSERRLCPCRLGLPLLRLDFVEHRLVGLELALLARVVGLLCLVVGLCWLTGHILMDHRDWNITTRERVAPRVGSARGLRRNCWRVRCSRRLRLPWKQKSIIKC